MHLDSKLRAVRRDAILPPHIDVPRGPLDTSAAIHKPVLLTGATGFLGSFILERLLTLGFSTYCLVRAADENAARDRLTHTLERYALASSQVSKVHTVTGDLALPAFGLAAADYSRLTRVIGTVIHSGASVNFLAPYTQLRRTNAEGTLEVIRFCCTSVPKYLHFVSTIGVLAGLRPGAPLLEVPVTGAPPMNSLGYLISKWVAESLVLQAGLRGLPVSVLRPSNIASPSHGHAINRMDFLTCAIQECINVGAAPNLDLAFNFAPVDYVSGAVVEIASRQTDTSPTIYHLLNSKSTPIEQIVHWIQHAGYPVALVDYNTWMARLTRCAADATGATTHVLRAMVQSLMRPAHTRTVPSAALDLAPDDANTRNALRGSTLTCPVVSEELFGRWLAAYRRAELIGPPQARH